MSVLTQKTKVLLTIRWPVGGIRTFCRYVYNNFDPEKYEFTIIAPDYTETSILLRDLEKFCPSYIPVSESPSIVEFTRSVIRSLQNDTYSIVHAHGLTAALGSFAGAKKSGVPELVTLHDVFVGPVFRGWKGKGKKFAIAQIFERMNSIHCVSHDVNENLLESLPSLKRIEDRIVTIPNGIEVNRFLAEGKVDLHKQLGLDPNTYLIGFLGRFMAQKGFGYLVDALEILLQKAHLPKKPVILTFGEGGFVREEKANIENKGLSSYVQFLPFTPNIASVLKGLDVVVMPSIWEACPLQPMEALTAGAPFIGSNCIGLREVLKGTPALVVPVKDSGALAEALWQEICSPSKDKFQEFSSEAAQRFDVKKTSSALERLYEQILNYV